MWVKEKLFGTKIKIFLRKNYTPISPFPKIEKKSRMLDIDLTYVLHSDKKWITNENILRKSRLV